ncbi:MAG: transposase, partial [Dysgonamonadaceae bacterium]|nr:transposase [Dysgonamonadaceae bacterium]
IVESEWIDLSSRYQNIELHEYVVMPNHFHGIIEILPHDAVGATLAVAQNDTINRAGASPAHTVAQNDTINGAGVNPAHTVAQIVGTFKSLVMKKCLEIYKSQKQYLGKLWQRNYFEHIIRNYQSFQTISEYIINNPIKWENDKFYKIENSL